ncbi:hypothetical protein JTB14_026045 [Gonioctena quinquepunctata]|nr:hypothetical protein JTB14_026045 [Gonioctena quinquepunctata]
MRTPRDHRKANTSETGVKKPSDETNKRTINKTMLHFRKNENPGVLGIDWVLHLNGLVDLIHEKANSFPERENLQFCGITLCPGIIRKQDISSGLLSDRLVDIR